MGFDAVEYRDVGEFTTYCEVNNVTTKDHDYISTIDKWQNETVLVYASGKEEHINNNSIVRWIKYAKQG
jgi:hypothetical protein